MVFNDGVIFFIAAFLWNLIPAVSNIPSDLIHSYNDCEQIIIAINLNREFFS